MSNHTVFLMKYQRPSIMCVEMTITRTKLETITYDVDEGFMVDIVYDPNKARYEAWLYNKEYGVKMHMFGLPKLQESDNKLLDHRDFLEIVKNNLESEGYIQLYMKEYFD